MWVFRNTCIKKTCTDCWTLWAFFCVFSLMGLLFLTGVHDGDGSTWLDIHRVYIHPVNGEIMDNNTAVAYKWKRIYTVVGWAMDADVEWDMALIQLKKDDDGNHAGNVHGWMAFGYDNNISTSYYWNLVGYPEDKVVSAKNDWMHYDYDGTYSVTSSLIHHSLDTWSGQSGAGLYLYVYPDRVIYGIHRGRSTEPGDISESCLYNVAVRIDSGKYTLLCDWIAEDAASAVC
eukprot:m.43527 g.43527  ORF g.43527 m.43527 type:complete len:231 (-) comp9982_c0_seq4:92-784(-)